MNTILVLDDDLNRRDKFDKKLGKEHHLWMVDNPLQAIENIRLREYDAIFLDHDLGHDLTGTDVAYCFYRSKNIHAQILIHSINTQGAMRMYGILRDLGCPNVRVCQFMDPNFWWVARKHIVGADP